MPKVAIIGSGFSGTLLCFHLQHLRPDLEITLVEKQSIPARGVAYSTSDDDHYLNVPVEKMSAFPDQPLHFQKWAGDRLNKKIEDGTFLPRKIYGQYIGELFEKIRPSIHFIHGECKEVFKIGNRFNLRIDEKSIEADAVVLAIGNFPFKNTFNVNSSRYIAEPWLRPEWVASIQPNEKILLIGTGLTALDWIASLQKLPVKVFALSRHGLLPMPHAPSMHSVPNATLHESLRAILSEIRRSENWRASIDSLRPASQKIWKNFSKKEKSVFLNRLRTYWDVHRHRCAPQIAEKVRSQIDSGKLTILRGAIQKIENEGQKLRVDYAQASSDVFDRVVNCTGASLDYSKARDSLPANLIQNGFARSSPTGFGFLTDDDGKLVDRDDKANANLFTLGPPRMGMLWESTAVPELRTQARDLALFLADFLTKS